MDEGRERRQGVFLDWPGRVWRGRQRSDTSAGDGRPLTFVAPSGGLAPSAGPSTCEIAGDGAHRLVGGDTLEFARALLHEGLGGQIDLVYVDPPYASDRDYVAEARLDGPADGRVLRAKAYDDRWSSKEGGIAAYLEMLAPRLEALAALLGKKGTLWVHLDWRAAYLVRAILDEIFGRDGFLNEIVWRRAPNLGRQAASAQFGRTLDTLLVYGKPEATLKPPTRLEPIEESAIRWDEEGRPFTSAPRGDYTDASIKKLEAEGRVHRTASGRVYIKYFLVKNEEGVWCRERRVDALWTDVPPLRHAGVSERTGYPTQKPRALLERIIACATEPNALVVDGFAGSGTTAAAAHALGRRSITCDASNVAIAIARARLLRQGAGLRVERLDSATLPAAAPLRVTAASDGSRRVVRLLEPEEPLAWAIGRERDGVFHCAWHSERTPGTRPIPAAREATIDEDGVLSARVWGDDGSLASQELGA